MGAATTTDDVEKLAGTLAQRVIHGCVAGCYHGSGGGGSGTITDVFLRCAASRVCCRCRRRRCRFNNCRISQELLLLLLLL